jgi:hypothetical protein
VTSARRTTYGQRERIGEYNHSGKWGCRALQKEANKPSVPSVFRCQQNKKECGLEGKNRSTWYGFTKRRMNKGIHIRGKKISKSKTIVAYPALVRYKMF